MMKLCLLLGALICLVQASVPLPSPAAEFSAAFEHTAPFNQFIVGVDVSTLELQKAIHEITLEHNEKWTDVCLDIKIGAPLPQQIASRLPATFLEVRVFYNIVPTASSSDSDAVMCAMDAMVCADGSTVGRTGPKCEFYCPNDNTVPVGGMTYSEVYDLKNEFENVYYQGAFRSYFRVAMVDTIANSLVPVELTPKESLGDWCIFAYFEEYIPENMTLPTVYKGARVVSYQGCSNAITGDCMAGYKKICGEYCSCMCVYESGHSNSNHSLNIILPITVIVFVALLTVCCCRIKRRKCNRKCQARCQARCAKQAVKPATRAAPPASAYPAQQYERVQQEERQDVSIPMPMPMPMPMHMPMMPMMVNPNGIPTWSMETPQYPIMIQGPNGVWLMAPPSEQTQQ